MILRLTMIAMLLCASAVHAQMLVVTGGGDAALERQVSNVELNDLAARDALQYLADIAGLGLIVNWDRLAESGYDPAHRVSISLRGVSLRIVLKLLLSDIFEGDDIVVEITPEYIRVLTREQADNAPVVKVYSIADVIHNVPNFVGPDVDLGSGAGDTGTTFEEGEEGDDQPQSQQQRGEQVAELIRSNIQPDIWEENGGAQGRISYFQGKLIIMAPEYVHQQIGLADRVASDPASATGPTAPPPTASTTPSYTAPSDSAAVDALPTSSTPQSPSPAQTYRPWMFNAPSNSNSGPGRISGIDTLRSQ